MVVEPKYFLWFLFAKGSVRKGADELRRNKYLPIIGVLGILLLMYLIVNLITNLRVYIVYSSGVGPFIFVGAVIVAMVILFLKGSRGY